MAVRVSHNGVAPDEQAELESIEIDLLVEAIYRRYGFDFRNYAPASLKRRIQRRMSAERVGSVSALQERVLHEPAVMERLLLDLSVNVTAMFRDPGFYVVFREKVVPLLRTYPFVRIWNAGCATGEETYSLAILLKEEGIYDKARIYATDFNQTAIEQARAGVFPLDRMRDYTANYIRAGGQRSFSEYYVAGYDGAQFQAIVCRNVMIYFDRDLQERVHALFYDSLVTLGVLGLGRRESARFTSFGDRYEPIDTDERVYR